MCAIHQNTPNWGEKRQLIGGRCVNHSWKDKIDRLKGSGRQDEEQKWTIDLEMGFGSSMLLRCITL